MGKGFLGPAYLCSVNENRMRASLEVALFVVAVAWDLASLVLNARRAIKGHGASGVPVIAWLAYLALFEWCNQKLFFASVGQAAVVLSVFHVFCHFGFPWMLELLFKRRKMD